MPSLVVTACSAAIVWRQLDLPADLIVVNQAIMSDSIRCVQHARVSPSAASIMRSTPATAMVTSDLIGRLTRSRFARSSAKGCSSAGGSQCAARGREQLSGACEQRRFGSHHSPLAAAGARPLRQDGAPGLAPTGRRPPAPAACAALGRARRRQARYTGTKVIPRVRPSGCGQTGGGSAAVSAFRGGANDVTTPRVGSPR